MTDEISDFDARMSALQQALKVYRDTKQGFTVKGAPILAVAPAVYNDVLTAFEQLASVTTPDKSSEVVKIRDQFEKESKQVLDLNKAIDNAREKSRQVTAAYDELNGQHKATLSEFKQYVADACAEVKKQQELIALLQSESASYAKQLKTAEGKYNPDTAVALQQRADDANTEKEKALLALADAKAQLTAIRNERDVKSKDLAAALRSNNEAHSEYRNLQQISLLLKQGADLPPKRPIENAEMLKIFLGANGMSWLQKLDRVNRANMRDRVFHLVNIARQSENQKVRVLKTLLEALFNWVKSLSLKLSIHLDSWITMLENDIKSMHVQSLKAYRNSLEEIKIRLATQKAKNTARAQKAKVTKGPFGRFVDACRNKVASVVAIFTPSAKREGSFIANTGKALLNFPRKVANWVLTRKNKADDNLLDHHGKVFFSQHTEIPQLQRILAAKRLCWMRRDPQIIALVDKDLKECGFDNWDAMIAWSRDNEPYSCPNNDALIISRHVEDEKILLFDAETQDDEET